MSLIYCDGFDSYATADILKRWSSQLTYSSTPSIVSGGRNGGNRMLFATSGASGLQTPNVVLTFPSRETLIVGFFYGFTASGGVPASRNILNFRSSATAQGTLGLFADGRVYLTNSAGTVVATSAASVPEGLGTGAYIEAKITFGDAGAFELRVNGATEGSGTSDFKNGAAPASADNIRIGHLSTNTNCASRIDDFYLCDTLGSVNNDFLGDCRVDTIRPNGAGNYTQFTPSAGANWEAVDDGTPNTTDYVDSTTVGHRDSYAMGNLAPLNDTTVYAVQTLVAVNKDNSGFRQVRPFVRSGGVDGDGGIATLGTSQTYARHIHDLNPNGDVAWTEGAVNAMEAGVVVAA
jgi:hypothetical protein